MVEGQGFMKKPNRKAKGWVMGYSGLKHERKFTAQINIQCYEVLPLSLEKQPVTIANHSNLGLIVKFDSVFMKLCVCDEKNKICCHGWSDRFSHIDVLQWLLYWSIYTDVSRESGCTSKGAIYFHQSKNCLDVDGMSQLKKAQIMGINQCSHDEYESSQKKHSNKRIWVSLPF